MTISRLVGTLLLYLSSLSCFAGEVPLVIDNAWIPEAPPVSKVLAAYMSIKNTSKKNIVITGMKSDAFERIELHQTQHQNDIARMVRIHELSIPADTAAMLEPGGIHMMLFQPLQTLLDGDRVSIVLTDNKGRNVSFDANVRKTSGTAHSHH